MTTTEVDISKISELREFFEQKLQGYIGQEDTPHLRTRMKELITECLEERGLREPVQTKYLSDCVLNDFGDIEKIWSDGTTEPVYKHGRWWSRKRKENLCKKIMDSERGMFHLIVPTQIQFTRINAILT